METSDIESRINFNNDMNIMEVDFSNLTFLNSGDVNLVYDAVERMINETEKQWYFLVDYSNTRIEPDAWFQHAVRGSSLNEQKSLGTVRFNPLEPARKALLRRSTLDEKFNPNLVSSREEAIIRIVEMKDDSKALAD